MSQFLFRATPFALSFLFAGLLAGCDNNPVSDDHEDEHSEVVGLSLRMNGVEVYRVLAGQVSCAGAPCGFTLEAGEETPLITTTFLDEDGDEIHGEDLEDSFSLGVAFQTAGIVEFEQHEEDGRWSFHLHAESGGSTRMQLELLHSGHADFTTPPLSSEDAILVTVN